MKPIRGEYLNKLWGVGAAPALYIHDSSAERFTLHSLPYHSGYRAAHRIAQTDGPWHGFGANIISERDRTFRAPVV